MKNQVRFIAFLMVILFGGLLAGCQSTNSSNQQTQSAASPKKVVFGVAPGPYGDMVRYAIKPGLEKKGYSVEIKEFSDWVQPNLALNNKELDANLFQHSLYLEKFSKDKGLTLSPTIKVPTAGMGIYSRKINAKTAEELKAAIKPGDEITLPNDPTNMARALRFLARNNLFTLKSDIDVAKVSEKDIADNPYNLKISTVEAAQLPRTLDSIALSVIPGNYAISAGIPLASAIILEELSEDIKNIIAVRTEDLEMPFVRDLKEVVESEDFKNVIEDPKYIFKDFQKPDWYKEKWNVK
ncbi:MAG: MetQ/NlpA family ABC transporter substrate-binding protein [Phycisphaerales bacterium]